MPDLIYKVVKHFRTKVGGGELKRAEKKFLTCLM